MPAALGTPSSYTIAFPVLFGVALFFIFEGSNILMSSRGSSRRQSPTVKEINMNDEGTKRMAMEVDSPSPQEDAQQPEEKEKATEEQSVEEPRAEEQKQQPQEEAAAAQEQPEPSSLAPSLSQASEAETIPMNVSREASDAPGSGFVFPMEGGADKDVDEATYDEPSLEDDLKEDEEAARRSSPRLAARASVQKEKEEEEEEDEKGKQAEGASAPAALLDETSNPFILRLLEAEAAHMSKPRKSVFGMVSFDNMDMRRYRSMYKGVTGLKGKGTANLQFYQNKITSRPDGDFIDEIHKKWFGDYDLLEVHHGYIQWLFPIPEAGMNWDSEVLMLPELERMKEDPLVLRRIVASYELMLDFYGLKLVNKDTGEVARSDNYEERYHNLNTRSHNYLRITRILKCLGLMGFARYQVPFLTHMMHEMVFEGKIKRASNSLANYWLGAVLDDKDRAVLERFVKRHA